MKMAILLVALVVHGTTSTHQVVATHGHCFGGGGCHSVGNSHRSQRKPVCKIEVREGASTKALSVSECVFRLMTAKARNRNRTLKLKNKRRLTVQTIFDVISHFKIHPKALEKETIDKVRGLRYEYRQAKTKSAKDEILDKMLVMLELVRLRHHPNRGTVSLIIESLCNFAERHLAIEKLNLHVGMKIRHDGYETVITSITADLFLGIRGANGLFHPSYVKPLE